VCGKGTAASVLVLAEITEVLIPTKSPTGSEIISPGDPR
jgi:hypothetical protein